MPLYYLSLIVAVVCAPLFTQFTQEITPYTIMRHVFFTQELIPEVSRTINPVLWTLSLEAVFYVVVPVLFLISRASFLLILIGSVAAYKIPNYVTNATFGYFFVYCYLFAIGMALAQYRWLISPPVAIVVVIAAVAVCAADLDGRIVGTAIALAMLLCILLAKRWQTSWALRALGFVGMISYSLYVWHYLLIDIVVKLIEPYVTDRWARAVILIAVSIIFAWVSYRLVEAPAQAQLRNWLLPRRKIATDAAA